MERKSKGKIFRIEPQGENIAYKYFVNGEETTAQYFLRELNRELGTKLVEIK